MRGRKTLVRKAKFTDRKLRDFVLNIVNAVDRYVDGSDDYLFREYGHFFPTRERDLELMFMDPTHLKQVRGDLWRGDLEQHQRRAVLGTLQNRLREVWLAKYDDVAEWRLFVLEREIYFASDVGNVKNKILHPPALDTPIERAIDWIRRNLLLLRVCRNPECSRPFFLARRAKQGLCSDCVSISQKAHKRRWWSKKKHRKPEPKWPVRGRIVKRTRFSGTGQQSEQTLKQFLHDIVNAPQDRFDYVAKRYAGFLPSRTTIDRMLASHLIEPAWVTPEELQAGKQQEMRQAVNKLQQGLRNIWGTDERTARWRLFNFLYELYISWEPEKFAYVKEPHPPPADWLLPQAVACLGRNLHMLRTCGNPACQTPFFIADKGRQTYCSDVCGRWSQQKAKAHWWKVEGPGWRKRRRLQQKKRRRIPRKTR